MPASPAPSTSTAVEHEIVVSAPATAVYRLLAKVANWPRIFPSVVHVDQVEPLNRGERIRVWETVDGKAKTWTTTRVFDPYGLRIEFQEEDPGRPGAVEGAWSIEPRSASESTVRLLRGCPTAGPADRAGFLARAHEQSRAELAALGPRLEAAHAATSLTFSFTDTVQ
ncbi:aromatase/cyclase, partial [Streptomyces albidoflavus]